MDTTPTVVDEEECESFIYYRADHRLGGPNIPPPPPDGDVFKRTTRNVAHISSVEGWKKPFDAAA